MEPSPVDLSSNPVTKAKMSQSADVHPIDVTTEDLRTMILYLRKARERAIDIRDRSPAGSYLESVLIRTIDGIALELSQLDYLLAKKPVDVRAAGKHAQRMRPAI
ncbi:hypothetical protein FMN50_21845 [Rhodobacterales bacterium]|nr:hypothetical protein FMN50_21845 [Rhodobacterales bacterium]